MNSKVVVIGCMRSGTTLMMDILRDAGFYTDDGRIRANNEHNIMANANIQIMNDNDIRWYHSRDVAIWNLRYANYRISISQEAKSKIAAFKKAFRDKQAWAAKDPRTTLTLPVWMQEFPDLKVIWCIRHPDEVVKSYFSFSESLKSTVPDIAKRMIDEGEGGVLKKWERYNRYALHYLRDNRDIRLAVVDYDSWRSDEETKRLSNTLSDMLGVNVYDSVLKNYDRDKEKSFVDITDRTKNSFYDELRQVRNRK